MATANIFLNGPFNYTSRYISLHFQFVVYAFEFQNLYFYIFPNGDTCFCRRIQFFPDQPDSDKKSADADSDAKPTTAPAEPSGVDNNSPDVDGEKKQNGETSENSKGKKTDTEKMQDHFSKAKSGKGGGGGGGGEEDGMFI